jgi:hypothetical protein
VVVEMEVAALMEPQTLEVVAVEVLAIQMVE